ncbi:MAG: hypothetical protein ACSHXY_00510 [Alphaproteobacteria bacterium]
MKVTLSNIVFGIWWSLHLLNCLRYAHYQLMVFLSKTGAKQFTALLCSVLVFLTHYLTAGLPAFDSDSGALGNVQTLFYWLQYDHETKGLLILIDVPLLALGLFAAAVPQGFLRVTLGMFPAMQRPMRPIRKVRARITKIKTVKAKIVVKPLPRPFVKDGTYDLVAQLPAHVRHLINPLTRANPVI